MKIVVPLIIGQGYGGSVLGCHIRLHLVHEIGHLTLVELRGLHPLVYHLTVGEHDRRAEHLAKQVMHVILVPAVVAVGLVEEVGDVGEPHPA